MLVVYNLVDQGSGGPDTLSLAAAILLGCIALLQFVGRSRLHEDERPHPATIMMLLVLAAILSFQAQWSHSGSSEPAERDSSARGAPDIEGGDED